MNPVVTANGTYSFLLAIDNTDGLTMVSREGTNKPQLVVAFGSAPASTATPTRTPTPIVSSSNTPTRTPTATAAPTTTTLTLAAAADARVEEAYPSSNFGTATTLRVDAGSDPDITSYLRFNVSGVTGTVQSAKLRVYATTNSANGPAAYSTSSSWISRAQVELRGITVRQPRVRPWRIWAQRLRTPGWNST